jgi:hypothetical protein
MALFKGWFPFVVLLNLISPSFCLAIQGECSVCHTMHNSQQGASLAYTLDSSGSKVISDVPLKNLLKTDCIGCHSYSGAETIVNMVDVTVPMVMNFTEPSYPPDGSLTSTLAGGNFHWMIGGGDAFGHNVSGIAGEDLRFPPNLAPGGVGRSSECIDCHGTLASVNSGCEGCHVPMHHANRTDGGLAGKDEGWYRFLGSVMQRDDQEGPPPEGVVGIESPDWEQNPLDNQHNTYQGKPGPYASYLESGAIDQKCVGCHGQFHNETIVSSVWIRHPADVAIPDKGEYVGLTTYNPLVPVARQNVTLADANFSVVKRGSDMVSCISCHRPHGSPYPAMMRWGYRDWPGNDSHTLQPAYNGCAVCHTSKD